MPFKLPTAQAQPEARFLQAPLGSKDLLLLSLNLNPHCLGQPEWQLIKSVVLTSGYVT